MLDPAQLTALLRFHVESGADTAIGERPVDRFAPPPPEPAEAPIPAGERQPLPAAPRRREPASAVATALAPPGAAAAGAAAQAAACGSLEELRRALQGFEGCSLKDTATQLVFADGNPKAPLVLVGEAPGREEDRAGLPFVGESGQLLDRMLAAIGLDREQVYIFNIVPWRPPGNRHPSQEETAICAPFARRHIELVGPRMLLLLGGVSAATLLGRSEGITRLRGRWHEYQSGPLRLPAMATFHPAYLLRQPALKRESWQDLIAVKGKLRDLLTA